MFAESFFDWKEVFFDGFPLYWGFIGFTRTSWGKTWVSKTLNRKPWTRTPNQKETLNLEPETRSPKPVKVKVQMAWQPHSFELHKAVGCSGQGRKYHDLAWNITITIHYDWYGYQGYYGCFLRLSFNILVTLAWTCSWGFSLVCKVLEPSLQCRGLKLRLRVSGLGFRV